MEEGEVEWKCVEVGEVEMVRWRRYFGEDIFEGDILENLVEGKRRKEKGKRKRK